MIDNFSVKLLKNTRIVKQKIQYQTYILVKGFWKNKFRLRYI